jgi:hypothetical protein
MLRGLLLLLVACDPLHTVNARVEVPASASGRAVAVISYDAATWDGVHLPSGGAQLLIAKPIDNPLVEGTSTGIGCPTVYAAAWVDLTGGSGLQELLAGRTVDGTSDYQLQQKIVALAPVSGDLLAVAGPHTSKDCPPPDWNVDLTVTAVP